MTAFYNEFDKYPAAWLRNLSECNLIMPGVVDERSVETLAAADVRGATQAHFFAGIGTWSYALRLAGWPDDFPIWSASLPCFAEGARVLTRVGFKSIESVLVGDEVLTHKNRWRPVTAVMRSEKQTVIVKGQGHWGLETTPEHPFLTGEEQWTPAANLQGKRWACTTQIPEQPVPPFAAKDWSGRAAHVPVIGRDFWHLVGYWLGDGWCRGNGVFICGDHDDEELLRALAVNAGLSGCATKSRTGVRFLIGSKIFSRWLTENFGRYASTKTIPTWLLAASSDVQRAFLEGLFFADGHSEKPKIGSPVRRLTTTSRDIAIGVRIICNRLGLSATITHHKPNRICKIEGRTVNERGFFRVTIYEKARSFKFGKYGWGLVRSTTSASVAPKTVWNIAVAEDESYVIDGIVVHNCQPFSQAGRGKGFDDERHLWPDFFKLVAQCRPQCLIGEQSASPDGVEWLDAVQTDLRGIGYTCGHAVLAAAWAGAPHIRHRIYWMAYTEEFRWPAGWHGRPRDLRDAAWLEFERHGDARALADAYRFTFPRPFAGSDREGDRAAHLDRSGSDRQPEGGGEPHELADADRERLEGERLLVRERGPLEDLPEAPRSGETDGVVDAAGIGRGQDRLHAAEGGGASRDGQAVEHRDAGAARGHRAFREFRSGLADALRAGRPERGAESDSARGPRSSAAGSSSADALANAAGGRQHQGDLGGAPREAVGSGQRALGAHVCGEPDGVGDAGSERGGRDAGAVHRAQAEGERRGHPDGQDGHEPLDAGAAGELGDTGRAGLPEQRGELGVARAPGGGDAGQAAERAGSPTRGLWTDAVWLYCRDGKYRPVESRVEPVAPGTAPRVEYVPPLAKGVEGRVGQIKGYGNAINSLVAATFIRAFIEATSHLCE